MTTIRCDECHCSNVQLKVWICPNHNHSVASGFCSDMLNGVNNCYCNNCQKNVNLDSFDDQKLLEAANLWWDAIPFATMEQLSGLKACDYSPEEGTLEFVSDSERWWDKHSDEEKIVLHKKHKEE